MKYPNIAAKIIGLKQADLKLRDQLIQEKQLGKGYHPAMEELHNRHAAILDEIIDKIGYPTIDKVGTEANIACWLVIQHAIGQADFMRKCAKLLADAVSEGQANPQSLAYLTDRIAGFEGKEQRYGTQFEWDAQGEMSPMPFDDRDKVNQRRRSIGLNTLEEQTELIRRRVVEEQESPPTDLDQRRQEFEAWRKKVGWIK